MTMLLSDPRRYQTSTNLMSEVEMPCCVKILPMRLMPSEMYGRYWL